MSRSIVRIHYMDAMRSILMMLGVVLHSSQVFNPVKGWIIYAPKGTLLATILVDIIHSFRMQAFFVISGFFCALTLHRYKPAKFLNVRLKRILVPIISTALSLNLLQALLLSKSGWHDFSFISYFLEGDWVSHLWFLNNLLIYFTLSALVFAIFSGVLSSYVKKLLNLLSMLYGTFCLLLLPFLSIGILMIAKIGFPLYENYFGIFNMYSLCIYFPYFIVGAIMGLNICLLNKFTTFSLLWLLLCLFISYFILATIDGPGAIFSVLEIYFENLLTWIYVILIFKIFKRLFSTHSPTWRFLSDASYTVYLFHHLLVIAFGLILIRMGLSPKISLLFLIFTVLVITLVIHKFIILKVPLLRFLYNGKYN